jgi:hypothetical protein
MGTDEDDREVCPIVTKVDRKCASIATTMVRVGQGFVAAISIHIAKATACR